jgi:hypothetical protein
MLDAIRLLSGKDNDSILLEGVSNNGDGEVYVSLMDIELLVEVYNWVMRYKDDLFEKIVEKSDDDD